VDYTSNAVIRSYPDGFDVEVFTFEALKKAYHNATNEYEKEHVPPYIHDSPDIFKILHVEAPKELMAPEMRITLDTREDYIVLCFVFDYLFDKNPFFSAVDIMDLFKQKSWLHFINQNITAKKHCETLEDEIKELVNIAKFQNYQKGQKFLEGCLLEHKR
jgi:spore coat polysaccharide biosynthesis protein SpsF